MDIKIGQAVWVPFGSKTLQGIVIELTGTPAVEEVKEIAGIIEAEPLLSPKKVALARWLSDYYLSPLADAVSMMLPPGFERRVVTFITQSSKLKRQNHNSNLTNLFTGLNPEQQKVLEMTGEGKTTLKEIEKALGKRKAQYAVTQLVNRGFLERSYELEKPKVKPKLVPYLKLLIRCPGSPRRSRETKRPAGGQAGAAIGTAGRPDSRCLLLRPEKKATSRERWLKPWRTGDWPNYSR